MAETVVGQQQHQRLPPPYHHHHHRRRYGRHGLGRSLGGTRGSVDYRIPAIEKYAYSLCLHVKPTTIFIASFKLVDALLFASLLLNAELSFGEQTSSDLSFNGINNVLVHRSSAIAFEMLTRIIMASVAAVAIYAVISGRAALLMPLYSVLLIDFFFTLPSFYGRDMDSTLATEGVIDMKNFANTTNDQSNRYSIFMSTVAMLIKVYYLRVIWKCYRYLRLIQLVSEMCSQIPSPIVRALGLEDGFQEVNPNHSAAPPSYDSITSNLKPPNYEDAIKSSNIYTIDVQAHNSLLPNYSRILPPGANPQPGAASTYQPSNAGSVSAPLNSDEVINFTPIADPAIATSTTHTQKDNPIVDRSDGQIIGVDLEPAQSQQKSDHSLSKEGGLFPNDVDRK